MSDTNTKGKMKTDKFFAAFTVVFIVAMAVFSAIVVTRLVF